MRSEIRLRGIGVAWITIALLSGLLAGCGSYRDRKHAALLTKTDVRVYLQQASESPSADERRKALNRAVRSKHLADPEFGATLAKIATTDESASVRTGALLALAGSDVNAACDACLVTLVTRVGNGRPREPNDNVRTAATSTLAAIAESGTIPDGQNQVILDTGIRLLKRDRSRNVRQQAADLLGYFPVRPALYALIDGLEQRDFGVCYEAERSLSRLTGRSFDHDPRAWRDFLAESNDPFMVATSEDVTADRGGSWFRWWSN